MNFEANPIGPQVAGSAAAVADPAIAVETNLGEPPVSGRLKVMIIDDNESERRRILESPLAAEIDFFEAIDAESGVALATAWPPDLLLVELWLPDHDGFELLKTIKSSSRTQGIPVILVSPAWTATDRARAQELGVLDCLTKPFDIQLLGMCCHAVRRSLQLRVILDDPEHRSADTNLANDRGFPRLLELLWPTCAEHGDPIVLIMMEIRPPRPLNGQKIEESAVSARELARVLNQCLRTTDYLAHTGEWRFAVIAPECEPAYARQLGERLRRVVARVFESSAGGDEQAAREPHSVGMGICALGSTARITHEAAVTIALANLERARDTGPDAVVVHLQD